MPPKGAGENASTTLSERVSWVFLAAHQDRIIAIGDLAALVGEPELDVALHSQEGHGDCECNTSSDVHVGYSGRAKE